MDWKFAFLFSLWNYIPGRWSLKSPLKMVAVFCMKPIQTFNYKRNAWGIFKASFFPDAFKDVCIAVLMVEKDKWFVEDMTGNLLQLPPSTVDLSKIGSSKFKRFLFYCNFILFLCVCLDVHLKNEVYRVYFWCKEAHRRCKVCAYYPIVPPQLVQALNDDFWKFWRVSTSIFLPSCFMKGWCLCDCFFKYGG